MLTFPTKTNEDLYEEHSFLETPLPGEADLHQDEDVVSERERYDDQIIAALVSP